MDIPVRSRCHRCLRCMENYHGLLPDTDYFDAEYAKKKYPVQLDINESLIGVYENKHGAVAFKVTEKIWNDIVITDKGLHLCAPIEYEKIYFKDMTKIEDLDNKTNDLNLRIRLKDNRVIRIPILYTSGRNGQLKDVTLFMRFLDRVIGDQEEQAI